MKSISFYEQFYEQFYKKNNIIRATLDQKCLPFSDSMPALCYSHGIFWDQLVKAFPKIFSFDYFYNSVAGPDWPTLENFKNKNFQGIDQQILNEINDSSRWNWSVIQHPSQWIGKTDRHDFVIEDQIKFVQTYKTRTPKGVLEIGGGLGYLGNTFGFLQVPYLGIDIALNVKEMYDLSAKRLFGRPKRLVEVQQGCISEKIKNIDLTHYDTIVMVASIEHIPEPRFDIFWKNIVDNFSGWVIIINWLDYHPINGDGIEHCFAIDDNVYDRLSKQATRCVYRNNSHLVLEF